MNARNLLYFALPIAFAPAVALAAPPRFSTSWTSSDSTSHASCISRARSAMRDAGFTNLEVVGDSANNPRGDTSIFGDSGEYSGSVRCITNRGIIMFMVAGPQSSTSSSLRRSIAESF